MTRTDVHAWIGDFPWRHLPSSDPAALRASLAREGFPRAWVGHLPSAWWRDPAPGNAELVRTLASHEGVLLPAPCIRPDWPRWHEQLTLARAAGAEAGRSYPTLHGLGPDHPAWLELGHAVAEAGLVLVLTQRFEDSRQRHSLDVAGDLTPAHVRALARDTRVRIVVGAASRPLIHEVHWGLTADEQTRVWYDMSWLWGPPEDELAQLIESVGAARLVEGTHWPLRLVEQVRSARELLPSALRASRFATGAEIAASARAR